MQRQKLGQEADSVALRLKDAGVHNSTRDRELQGVCQARYEGEVSAKDARAELDKLISDAKYALNKAEAENADLKQKIDETERK